MKKEKELKLMANTLRQDVVRMVANAGNGHPGGAIGMADIFAALYFDILNHNPKKPTDPNRDMFFLSNGHICAILYASLARSGYFPVKELMTHRKINSRLQGHPHNTSLPGCENSGGPLGQGISQAVGAAWALKHDKKKSTVYCVCGDGELNEGQVWEAALFAGHYKLDNLIQIIDRNNIQIDGFTTDVMDMNPLKEKFLAFNYEVLEMDAHDYDAIFSTFKKAKAVKGKPVCIIANTQPGKDVSYMMGDYHWHGKAPSKDLEKQAIEELQEIRKAIEEGSA